MNYIAMLRGINVSGQKKIKMNDLKLLFVSLGLKNITTYIQSGNVIFTSASKDKANLITTIERAIQKKFSFHVPIQLRTSSELIAIINNCPFGVIDIEKDRSKVLLTFLSSIPSKSAISEVEKYINLPEKCHIKNDVAYLYCPNGYGRSKLSNNFIESKLKTEATTRNWKTVCKLSELAAVE